MISRDDAWHWQELGHGTYNQVFKSSIPLKLLADSEYSGFWVKKIPQADESNLNSPARAERIYKLINPDLPTAVLKDDDGNAYWVSPFLEGEAPNDTEARACLLNIYRETRRTIFDGCGRGNLIKSQGKVVCVDVDVAIKTSTPHSPRSAAYVKRLPLFFEAKWWHDHKQKLPKTCELIETLYFLDQNVPAKTVSQRHITDEVMGSLYKVKQISEQKPHLAFDCKFLDYLLHYHQQVGVPSKAELTRVLETPREIDKFLKAAENGTPPSSQEDSFPLFREISALMVQHLAENRLSCRPLLREQSLRDKQDKMTSLVSQIEDARCVEDIRDVFIEFIEISKEHRNPLRQQLSFFSERFSHSTSTHSCQSLIKLLSNEHDEHKAFTNFLKQKNKLELLQLYNLRTYSCALFDSALPIDEQELQTRCQDPRLLMT